ncbi:bifunctional 3,4-dihydroxy-2-butanone-4-phosphate synthase/GTP cyclohydrolase II [Legionella pneumophila]|uniref:bifunctional 3,4-dihydroxy-2-butanone-4-phosphate synthase/GTP cyclohydrolase II n=1 Tax=Legionella pneumophila TaxID=446 RepID=UPI00047F1F80|nr:bifunctional 3,4-dihydroxy-2-butanone-4-phosphate synthase/GTP cyclohydrolase II [Legionella pneumophila]RYW92066.1 bifunctional 3,4-dihydroxy-2-butanone-4-phosphate synthase/GTP cyclohydrolase II [Legionella pneumophila]STX98662.1 Riboflavin biosynthesis protein [Legionella pneumophila]HAT1775783.1 bifunctional 3,4-dihydroxy-2-butanone-4-phosphate synthase/GTP cyclohydrolase II [Legionella pneumophila]HAT1778239.1 bifunctional 3,4-dihydroxy-2-butanone-4-phosphate synthase/GTP cyclohydrolase
MKHSLATIEEAVATLKAGKMIILMDDEDRENEGDLVIAAEHATPEAINFMSRLGCGLICLPMAEELIDKLQLPMMARHNKSPYGTAFTVSIEAANGVSTGISARDRARTIQVAIDPKSGPSDIISPGHVFPLRARKRGVLERPGQTEGSVDLVRLAGLTPAAVICEIINEDGTMSRRDELALFSKKHQIPLVTIKDLINYRIRHENLINPVATTQIPLEENGVFTMTVFENQIDSGEHFALVKPPLYGNQVPLVRIHSECITGDVFGSRKCDCGKQLELSLSQIGAEGGILIYLRQEGRGIGLANKLKAYALQEQGFDTVDANLELGLPADDRDYAVAYQILKYLGVEALRLLTNNPLKIASLERYGMKITQRIPLEIKPSTENHSYLKTKKIKLGHLLAID